MQVLFEMYVSIAKIDGTRINLFSIEFMMFPKNVSEIQQIVHQQFQIYLEKIFAQNENIRLFFIESTHIEFH